MIAGENYKLNPAEAYVFGAAIMLHDAAMSLAAYPQGLSTLKKTAQWRDAVASLIKTENFEPPTAEQIENPTPEVESDAVAEVLRELHASGAEQLPLIKWPVKGGSNEYLIQDSEFRNAYGHIIGKIAASHWWPVSDLQKRMPQRVNAGPGVPSDWYIDPRKLACLLRVADAAQVDHRRAPTFLMALLQPAGISAKHWTFQNKLGKPSNDGQFLVYTGGPFKLQDAEAWWLCYDMFSLVDEELRAVNTLLDAISMPVFAVKGVRGARNPEAVAELVTTEKWRPVNTELRVSDVPALVELLGGKRLYGDSPTVPLRELIQNASDAIRAKRAQNNDLQGGKIRIQLKDNNGTWYLVVEDDGIGMSANVMTGALLDFGRSFWRSAAIRREFPGLLAKGLKPTGRYGIGFFSIFMLGDNVTVTSRRFDAAASDTHTLDFLGGLKVRPILREPREDERLKGSGTRICVQLRAAADQPKGLIFGHHFGKENKLSSFHKLVESICPTLDVDVEVQDHMDIIKEPITANDWKTKSELVLLNRLCDNLFLNQQPRLFDSLRVLSDSEGGIYGRAAITGKFGFGAVTVGGFRACSLSGIAGFFIGEAQTVSRDTALPTVPMKVLRYWAEEQKTIMEEKSKAPSSASVEASALLLIFGIESDELPVAETASEYFSRKRLEEHFCESDIVRVYCGTTVSHSDDDDITLRRFEDEFELSEDFFLVLDEEPTVLNVGDARWPQCIPEIYPENHPRTCLDVFRRTLENTWGTLDEWEEDHVVGMANGLEITRNLIVFHRTALVDEE